MKKLFHLTNSGVEELQAELNTLVGQRGGMAERIKQARELGDLSENAEYQSARVEQDRLEARISEVEHVLSNTVIIKKPKVNGMVKLGSLVKLKANSGQARQFQIVGTMEANPLAGKVSDESPIGKALLGKAVGDLVEIKVSPVATYKIISIN